MFYMFFICFYMFNQLIIEHIEPIFFYMVMTGSIYCQTCEVRSEAWEHRTQQLHINGAWLALWNWSSVTTTIGATRLPCFK